MMLQDEFRQLILDELQRQGVTHGELARRMGVSRPMVSQYLAGRVSPGVDVVERFCRALGFVPHLSMTPVNDLLAFSRK